MAEIDYSDLYLEAMDILVTLNNTVCEYKESEMTGKDVKDFWSDLDKIGARIESVMGEHNERVVSDMSDDIEDDKFHNLLSDTDGSIH